MIHDLKILPEWFETVKSGIKTFEVRKDDRDFKPNDVLLLREFDGTKYTGRQLKADVRFVLRGEYCREGYCIMSILVQGQGKSHKETTYIEQLEAQCSVLQQEKAELRRILKLAAEETDFMATFQYADEALKLIGKGGDANG